MSTTVKRLLSKAGCAAFSSRRALRRRPKRARLPSGIHRLEERVLLSNTFTVTNTLDDGSAGSLRWAINQANAKPGKDVVTIDFDIPGPGPFTIAPLSPLPFITHPVFIDGYSQPGSSPNSSPTVDNAVIRIQLSGASAGFASGLDIEAGKSTVRGLAINQFAAEGIRLSAGGNDVVTGNFLGTDITGMMALPNGDSGVLVDGSNNDTVGGTTLAARNLVSGNTNQNIFLINGTAYNVVAGNWVGLTASAKATLFTDGNGIDIFSANNNTVGGKAAGAGNVVSGQTFDGVVIEAANGNVIQGNKIGTDPTGTMALGNAVGVFIGVNGAAGNTVGGTAPGAGNLISGNFGDGVFFNGDLGAGNAAQGNRIGTDITGTTAIPNFGNGVEIDASTVSVGGTTPGAGNIISGNFGDGVVISAFSTFGLTVPANDNLIRGNFIGTDATGTIPLGNFADGVGIFGNFIGAVANTVGGTATGAANIIAYNGHNGVTVGGFTFDSSAVQNSVLSNSIFANGALGIDLGDDGVTPNHSGPPPFAPNHFQNFPVLTLTGFFGSDVGVEGTLSAAPGTTYTIQIYGNTAADPSGFGQGRFLLGTVSQQTDSTGNLFFRFSTSSRSAGVQFITATATDPQGDTSEFAQDIPLAAFSTPIVALDDSYNTDINTTLSVPAPGVQANDIAANGSALTSSLVAAPAHGHVTLNPDGSFTYIPAANFVGSDAFTYMDVAKKNQSNVATVTITVRPKTFIVINTNDSGPGSLRQAMLDANLSNSAPPDTIAFDIPPADSTASGTFTISPFSALPVITHPTKIDGYTQPGSSPNTLALGDNAKILIQVDGAFSGFADGIVIAAGGSTVQGLAITDFDNGIHLTGAGNDRIAGNFIGTDPSGSVFFEGNFNDGVEIVNTGNNTTGGTSPAARNVISANFFGGIEIFNGSTGNLVQGNYIGTDAAGLAPLGNFEGILLEGAPRTTIGGTAAGAGNVISGNLLEGIDIEFAGLNLVQHNFIGTDRTGTQPLGNVEDGVVITSVDAANNTVGGTAAGAGNVIAFNGASGVAVLDPFSSNTNVGNAILSNLIYGNGALGIDLGGDGVTPNHVGGPIPGPNGFENFPVLTSAVSSPTQTTIDGTLNAAVNSTFTIQFYVNSTADPSGFGQGQIFVGSASVTTNASGNASFSAVFNVSFATGLEVSATATDPNGNTSEFAQDIAITASAAIVRAAFAPVGAASVDQALQSLSISPLDETILNAVAGAVSSSRPKRALSTL
jgi:hypothetical protein